MTVDVMHLSYILSSAASTGKIIESTIALIKAGVRPSLGQENSKMENELTSQPIGKDDIEKINAIAYNIPQVMVDALETAIQEIQNSIARSIGDTKMPIVEMEQRITADQRNLCARIAAISKFGPLPSSLVAAWETNKCADYGFSLG